MESNSLAQQLLPRQKNGTVTKLNFAYPASFYSNIFQIKLKSNAMSVYQYCFDITPELPPDSDGLIEKIAKTILPDLKKNIGLICFRGFMAWGRKEMKTVLTCKAEFIKNQAKLSYDVLVKPTKSIGLQNFLAQNADNLSAVSQVLNINAKQKLRDEKMIELYPGSYFSSDFINLHKAEGRLNVWRGFDITVSAYNKRLFLQIDPCSRVLREESFLQTLEADRQRITLEEINFKYKGHPVLRRYGAPKIYKIQEVDYSQSPRSLFYFSKEGKDISYLEYYKKEYGVVIKIQNQPLLKVLADRKMNRNKEANQKLYVFLVPELVCLTGLTDQQRNNFRIMKSLGEYTKLTAGDRMKQTKNMLQILQSSEDLIFDIADNPKQLNGFKMKTPDIQIGKKKIVNVQNGTIFLKEKVLDPFCFKEMIFCYSVGNSPQMDRDEADDSLDLLRNAGKTFGIEIDDPIWVEVKQGNRLNNWIQFLLKEKKNMKKPAEIIFFFLKPSEQQLYPELKKFVAMQFNCPCQVATRQKLDNRQKGRMSVASKIAMQMNAKVGHPLWVVKNQHPIWKNKTVAIAGIASSKGKKGTSIAFTGTTNPELDSFYSDCKQTGGRQSICTALFQGLFLQWIQKWFKKNQKQLPEVLVVYREGINEMQARFQFEFEVEGLKQTIQKVKQKAQQPKYDPTIVYILVNKKPSSRIFEGSKSGKEMSYFNPEPGSVIFQDLSQGYKEFHLASATVREGTCTPVSFKIGYENRPEFPLDAISELTYNQTYGYFNWTGSVRVPAPLQYANKLAKQYSDIGEDLKTQSKNSELKSQLFYL